MLYHAGPSSLVFFAECLKIITDSDLQIQNYQTKVQLKPKLQQLWRIALWLGKLQLSVFLKIVRVFSLDRACSSSHGNSFWIYICYCHFVIKSCATYRPKSQYQSALSTVSVLATRSLEQWSQMFVYRPFCFSLSPVPHPTKGLFTG